MRNTVKSLLPVCNIIIMAGIVNLSFIFCFDQPDKVALAGSWPSYVSQLGYKPVPDVPQYIYDGDELTDSQNHYGCYDNFPYKEWCEETFDNGNYIYDAYRNIAFNIKYSPELKKTDFWQTPIETISLKRGDCEDAALLFFSQIPPNQKNAEIVWGWVINKRSKVGKAHVWYQLTDKRGKKYIVESFSKDWNGIIPMKIIENHETRKPILTISHCMVSKLSLLFPEVDEWQMCQTLANLFTSANRETYNILKKLHEVFSRYENQKNEFGSTMLVVHRSEMRHIYTDKELICKR